MTVLSFPKAVQLLRDEGGRAWRMGWSESTYLTLSSIPWNREREALLIHRPRDGRSPQEGEVAVIFQPFGEDVRGLDWQHAKEAT